MFRIFGKSTIESIEFIYKIPKKLRFKRLHTMFIGNFHIKPHDKAHDKIYGFSKVHDKISKPHDRNSVMRPLMLTLEEKHCIYH